MGMSKRFAISPDGATAYIVIEAHSAVSFLVLKSSKVTREGQAEVLVGYLRQGLVVGALEGEGYTGKLLQKRMAARLKEKRDAFLASLTPEQKNAYTTPQPAIRYADPPAVREQQSATAKTGQARRDHVLAKLTPEQQALYEEYRSWMNP